MTPLILKRLALGLLLGGGIGVAYHFLVGCRTGACPLTATPLRSGLYGGFMGLVWALAGIPKP